jgi:TPR repeat protein
MKAILAVALVAFPLLAQAQDDSARRAQIKHLGGAIKAYGILHENKPPAKLSDLYRDGLADKLSDFVCPGSGTTIASEAEIDAKCDYTLEPIGDKKDMLVREKTPVKGGNTVLAIFADGKIEALPVSGGTTATPAPSATASAMPSPTAPPATPVASTTPATSPSAIVASPTPIARYTSGKNDSGASNAADDYARGWQYFQGRGVVLVDIKKAYELFERAANEGMPEAQARLADFWDAAGLVDFIHPRDEGKARTWAERAITSGLEQRATEGESAAEFELGQLYSLGLGVPKDDAKSVQLFRSAEAHGSHEAERVLGFYYWGGFSGLNRDGEKAKELLTLAAAANLATAQLVLGVVYQGDKDDPKAMTKALEYYQKAADQGLPTAMDALANCYAKGMGVSTDLVKARELYERAAQRGLWSSLQALGDMYENGRGVPRDLAKAASYYQQVADQDIKSGKEALARVSKEIKK